MENISRPVVVKRMPETMNLKQARSFLKEVAPFLNSDRPQLVFDMSQVRLMDAGGIDVFRSDDGGKSWRALDGIHGKSVRTLSMAPSDHNILVAGALDAIGALALASRA